MTTNAYEIKDAEVKWKIVESREEPANVTLQMLPPKIVDLIKCLSVVGVIGSVAMKDIFFKNNKKYKSMAKDYRIIEEHQLIRNGTIIPLFTLGATGIHLQKQLGGKKASNYWIGYTVDDVMKCIVTYQMLGRYRQISDTFFEDISMFTPFTAAFVNKHPKGTTTYNVGVLRNDKDVADFDMYYRMEEAVSNHKIIFIVTDLQLLNKLEGILKPYLPKIRVAVDTNLKQDIEFKNMFHRYENGSWVS